MAGWYRHQILGWISSWQMNDNGNPIQWFQRWSELNFGTSNYEAHKGCPLWLPYREELKMKSLTAWDTQLVDKSMFSRIGQHSTPTGTTYIHMKQSAAEYRKALFLQLCVQWTAKSTVRFTICMLLLSIYNHIMVFWVVTCVNVGGYKCLKRTCQLHLQDKNERERCGHVL